MIYWVPSSEIILYLGLPIDLSHSADGTELNDKSASPGTRFSGIEVRDLLVSHLKNPFVIQLGKLLAAIHKMLCMICYSTTHIALHLVTTDCTVHSR